MFKLVDEKSFTEFLNSKKKSEEIEFSFTCNECKKQIETKNKVSPILKRLGEKGFSNFCICRPCSIKKGCGKRPLEEIEKINEKRKATNLKKYGVENPFQDKDKIKKACVEKLGVENPSQLKEIQEKKKETLRKNYGVENPSQSDEIKARRENTMQEKFGVKYNFQRDAVKEILKENGKNPERIEKIKEIWKSKSNVDMEEFKQKVRDAWIEKTSEELLEIRKKSYKKYLYKNHQFDSSWELALWIYAEDYNLEIIQEPCSFEYFVENEKHIYTPDFLFNKNLVELKGDQFIGENGVWKNPFDESKNEIFKAKYNCAVSHNVKIYSSKEMKPILDYIFEKYTKDYLHLFERNLEFPFPKKEETDFGIMRYFHKSIFEASKKNSLSPLKAWEDKEIIRKVALNRLKYVKRCTPEDILQGMSVTRIASKVSMFKPSLAERLIKTYLSEFGEVFDPFSGFSGRLVGTVNCGKKYIGQDLDKDHVRESNEIIQYKHYENCSVVQQDILTDIEQIHECLFTCPPYGSKEHWNENNNEVEKSCDEWIDICLQNYKCKKYLFVVDKTEKYKDKIVEKLENKTHFGTSFEYVVLI